MTDAVVVRRVLEGDVEAFGTLVNRYYDRYARYAVHITGNREDAEEALQDAFVRAYRALEQYEERERFAAWLHRIVVNQCRSVLARRKREESNLVDLDPALACSHASIGTADDPASDRLQALLAILPLEQREALVLKYMDDMTFEEMSTLTGVGVSALKMRVRRALDRLRAILPEQPYVLL